MSAKSRKQLPEVRNAALARSKGPVSRYIAHHFRHFNAASLLDAAMAYEAHVRAGGKMLVTLAGAMSTAELGISLAEMIRRGKVHAIVCTGANLEEDVFNLVAHDYYERVPDYRHLTPKDEVALLRRHMNRVTDTCIPEMEAMRRIERIVLGEWVAADREGRSHFPHEFLYKILRGGKLSRLYQIDPKNSWLLAACEKNLPIVVPGWEDSTLGNMFAAHVISGVVRNVHTVRSGVEYMAERYPVTVEGVERTVQERGGHGSHARRPRAVRPRRRDRRSQVSAGQTHHGGSHERSTRHSQSKTPAAPGRLRLKIGKASYLDALRTLSFNS